ncbi:uncharacterized protein LOC132263570 [Phlebotomus argentipes]|uniref:uncharacterized protein LOC132263570 n=1 Tax=Phlebotomus argentipes TaxID=94469 RepID=UPI0028936E2A|nr:uncharacterized protein LOC132263570 [Phlebotomus argentipes]
MFKKLPPAPPMLSLEEILADMETFKAEKPEVPETRCLEETENVSLDDWWKLFETFLKDVEHLKDVRTRLEELRNHLQEKNHRIKAKSAEIHEQIDKNLEEVSLFEEEIKIKAER